MKDINKRLIELFFIDDKKFFTYTHPFCLLESSEGVRLYKHIYNLCKKHLTSNKIFVAGIINPTLNDIINKNLIVQLYYYLDYHNGNYILCISMSSISISSMNNYIKSHDYIYPHKWLNLLSKVISIIEGRKICICTVKGKPITITELEV